MRGLPLLLRVSPHYQHLVSSSSGSSFCALKLPFVRTFSIQGGSSSSAWRSLEARSDGRGDDDDATSSGSKKKSEEAPVVVDFLKLSERDLLAQCKVDTFRASGPGGQHRNKTESAVRLRHLPTGLVSQASDDRSQNNNRILALNRLRQLIAVEVRRPVELEGYKAPPELMRILPNVTKARREREGIQQIGAKHPDFVLGLQVLLDLLWSVNGSISECAALLGLSTGALSRLIVSERTVWNAVNNLRISHNLKPLRGD
ncbi:hypothetical protein CY35_14G095700 [Sphagnum magellanicum]|nr:hypothetical protein CY35_14G095700 [Sphagnum magellanicum]